MQPLGNDTAYELAIRFHGDLPLFLRKPHESGTVRRVFREKTSVKDAIESCGVPHPEIDLVLVNRAPVDFGHQLVANACIDVFPVGAVPPEHTGHLLQRRSIARFVADGHLGKLARDLRLLGFDLRYAADPEDAQLVAIATKDERALLTRDRRLLMHAAVRDGYCPRSDTPTVQTLEVIRRFQLASAIDPLTRCIRCNGSLAPVEKAAVFDRLEPLTRIFYDDFRECEECRQIYWRGTHSSKLNARIDAILAAVR
ncbi:MAG: hypothetical protein H0X73_12210 [Chthoniobacterales bacterium]|nr:hypothetical protein [Chthoniobacterales bacterium]